MPSNQTSIVTSYISASAELDEVCAWLERIGIGFSVTRLGRYKIIFSTLADAQRTNNFGRYNSNFKPGEFMNALIERAQLVRIHDGLGRLDDPKLIERIKKALRSHELFVMDNDGRSGRDFSLELDVAAKFARSGFEIDFGHDADVKATKDGLCLFVECKRLKSKAKIRENIKAGLKQLKNRYKSSDNPDTCRGLLVLSIGKIVNPDFGFMEGKDIQEAGDRCTRHVDAFMSTYSRYWLYEDGDRRTLGVVIIMDVPARTLDRIEACLSPYMKSPLQMQLPTHPPIMLNLLKFVRFSSQACHTSIKSTRLYDDGLSIVAICA